MTVKEMTALLDKTALLATNELKFPVLIKDVKKSWDRTDCLITPVNGSGETWVSLRRLTLSEEG